VEENNSTVTTCFRDARTTGQLTGDGGQVSFFDYYPAQIGNYSLNPFKSCSETARQRHCLCGLPGWIKVGQVIVIVLPVEISRSPR